MTKLGVELKNLKDISNFKFAKEEESEESIRNVE